MAGLSTSKKGEAKASAIKVKQNKTTISSRLCLTTTTTTHSTRTLVQVVIQTVESLTSNAAGGGDRPKDESDDPDKVGNMG